MKRKAALVLLIGAVALCLMGCGEDETAKNTNTGKTTTSPAPEDQTAVQPAPGGPGDTARTGETPGGPAGAGADVLAQQKNEYVQGAETILNNMEQKLTAWQQQAGAQAQDPKIQELSKQTQQQIADARAVVDKMRTATGTQLKDAKVAADQAIQSAEQSFKNFQSQVGASQVTQAQ